MNDYRYWKDINRRLVNRGKEITLFLDIKDTDFEEELSKMNKGKRGSPYEYPNTLIYAGMVIKCLQHKAYRQLQGYIEDLARFLHIPKPDFRTFWWRTNKMEKEGVRFNPPPLGTKIDIAVDSTGIKLVNDGEYRTMKYKKTKDWVKFHTSVNENTGESLTIVITKDNIADMKRFRQLMDPISDITNKADADKGYDCEDSFGYCAKHDIIAGIPVRINATTTNREAKYRRRAVSEQFGIPISPGIRFGNVTERQKKRRQKKWKKAIKQGKRWAVEGFYSRYKRQFGEYAFSKKRKMVEKEIVMKTNILNKFITTR